jgi:hypothetical protein
MLTDRNVMAKKKEATGVVSQSLNLININQITYFTYFRLIINCVVEMKH